MRKHKFLILADSEHAGVVEQIRGDSDEAFIAIIKCHHEKWDDNLVTFKVCKKQKSWCTNDKELMVTDEYTFVRDVEGSLWYYSEVYSRQDLIKAME